MRIGKQVRPGRLVVSGIALMAVVALFLAWGHSASRQVGADVPAPGLAFSIAVAGVDGCDTTAGDANCYLEPGSTFTLNISLDSLPDGVSEYEGFDLFVTYTGVSSEDNVDWLWPECEFPAEYYAPGEVGPGCAIGLPPAGPSTYTGVIATNDFTCSESPSFGNTITLVHGTDDTQLVERVTATHAEGDGTTETLTINCGEEPEPTAPGEEVAATEEAASPTAIATGLPPTGNAGSIDADGGVSTGLWALIGALLVAAAAGLAAFGWRYARSR